MEREDLVKSYVVANLYNGKDSLEALTEELVPTFEVSELEAALQDMSEHGIVKETRTDNEVRYSLTKNAYMAYSNARIKMAREEPQ